LKILISEEQLKTIKKSVKGKVVHCEKCGWEWDLSKSGKDTLTCHKCGHKNKEQDIDERSRSLAFSRKKRLYPEPARRYAKNRFRYEDRIDENDKPLNDKQVKSIEDLNKDAKFLKCKNCNKKFTQTTHKGKKSLPICPWCGTHNK
jgi:DNA-directed RNA polymerase subunit RPC12/RpoP